MLGIDVIDLNDPLFKKRNKSNLRFIVHPQDLYGENENAFWYLWTAKEATFKANRELTSFTPKEIPVRLEESQENAIPFKSNTISGNILIHNELIISLASKGKLKNLDYHFFRRETKNVSEEARTKISQYISEHKNIDVRVVSDGNGLPVLDYQNLPVSISHHGNYIAFTYPKI